MQATPNVRATFVVSMTCSFECYPASVLHEGSVFKPLPQTSLGGATPVHGSSLTEVVMESEAKIQAFLLLGKNLKGRSCAEFIAKATSEPGLYNFGELWDLPGVQDVRCSRLHVARTPAPQLIKSFSLRAAEGRRVCQSHSAAGALLLWHMVRLQRYLLHQPHASSGWHAQPDPSVLSLPAVKPTRLASRSSTPASRPS